MDIDPQSIDKSSWSSDDKGSSHVRSYTCAFCKRGFSNAQALGGHMNIHRKDRARLNQASDENLLSLDITKTNPIDLPEISRDKNISHQLESSEEKSCTSFTREDDATPKDKDNMEELQQLPLFVEMPSPSDDKKASSSTGENEEKKMQFSQGSSSQIELDLELRLGPEPHKTSTKRTRELL